MSIPAVLCLVLGAPVPELKGPKDPFGPEAAAAVRSAVYEGETLTIAPNGDFVSELVVPEPVTKAYEKHPRETIELLLKIMEGANPRDSVLAAGFALSLQTSPKVGVVCVEHFDKKTYDAVDPDWKVTPRQHWIGKVRERLKP